MNQRLTPLEHQERRAAWFEAQQKRKEDRDEQALTSSLRRRYLAAGGGETEFEAALPRLLKQHREDAALGRAEVDGAPFSDPKYWGLNR